MKFETGNWKPKSGNLMPTVDNQVSSIKYQASSINYQVSRKRLVAIGDIHGQFKMLELLMKKIQPQQTDKFIFIGDYIDRGLQSKDVIEFLIKFSKKFECIFLRGNHEDMLMSFLGIDDKAMYGNSYKYNGGETTAISYAGKSAVLEDLKYSIPENHIDFLKRLKYYHIENNFLFVHAGIIPGFPINEQKLEDLLWIRDQFLYYPTGIDKIVVFGHTPLNKVLISNDKIGLDTGAGYNIALSAIELNTKKIFAVKWKELTKLSL